ncbi:MAG TPA: helix-turn-helix transcriptional regulator [Terriglobales bacterium]|nr:helix-turn-helix transcriptional regulator [Terriglobales bacterium]
MTESIGMDATGPSERAGVKLKQLRERLGLTLRQVEAESRRLAEQKKNPDFLISRGWLNNIENGIYKPSIFKLYTLGAIYHVHWSAIFSYFGCDMREFGRDQAMFAPPRTQLASESPEPDEILAVPLRSRPEVRLDKTNLLSRLVEIWGDVPNRLIQHLDLRNGVYGFVGMGDRTMYPIIRPGSIVQIDQNQRKIIPKWRNEHERPIYFIELRGEYICSWCEIRDRYLSAIPHPNSDCTVRRFAHPREAEIVGRVIGVTMRIAEAA